MYHVPVLLHEVLNGLLLVDGDIVLDMNLGLGGHSEALCTKHPGIALIGIDADPDAVSFAQKRLANAPCSFQAVVSNFRNVDTVLKKEGIKTATKVLFDLGLSSAQLASGRGFSFKDDEPLQMTFSGEHGIATLTAETIINEWSEESIADILHGFGEERYARRIAQAIVTARTEKPITTTHALVAIITNAVPASYRHGKIHPATKTFQALRIAVNDELGALREALEKVYAVLAPQGRIAVISFHSLEDRIVKRFFKAKAQEGSTLITKKPIVPSDTEQAENPRSRSAKLRILEK